eukprot:3500255-Pleurochrysis_carterae.AAC.1
MSSRVRVPPLDGCVPTPGRVNRRVSSPHEVRIMRSRTHVRTYARKPARVPALKPTASPMRAKLHSCASQQQPRKLVRAHAPRPHSPARRLRGA